MKHRRSIDLVKGRGAVSNLQGRFEKDERDAFDDGWSGAGYDENGEPLDDSGRAVRTVVTAETAKSILAKNDSPDIFFNLSINPYRGCEHGCTYCYARPTHSWLGLSPGLDFETRITAKVNAAELLREELSRRGYRPEVINVGSITDPYQPAEREWGITRKVLEVMAECGQPCTLITKSALIERDIDLLAPMAGRRIVSACVSVTTLDADMARTLEPRASAPWRRIEAIRRLAQAGIPVAVSIAPVIPFVTDEQMERILEAAREAGASAAMYIVLRLPWEVDEVFQQWLAAHLPLRAERVMNRVRDMRGGRDNDPRFGSRMKGEGIWADLIRQRFRKATARLGYAGARPELDCSQFRPPAVGGQMALSL